MSSELGQIKTADGTVVPVLKKVFIHRDEILGVDTEDEVVVLGIMVQPEVLVKPRVGRPKGAKKKFSMKSPLINGPDVHAATPVN